MPQKIIGNWRTLSNRFLFFLNLLILLMFVFVWLLPKYKVERLAAKQANDLNMRYYFARPPFFVFVDSEFPLNENFTFLQQDRPLVLSGNRLEHTDHGDVSGVSLALGADFSLSCKYSLYPDVKAIEYTIAFKSFAITDLNADGFPDIRTSWTPRKMQEVWYGGKWTEVQRGDGKGQKRLLDGCQLYFDAHKGVWGPDSVNENRK